jgi:hypothetical protein
MKVSKVGHTFTLCFDPISFISVRIFRAKKKLGFLFLISHFASKHKKKIFPSYFPVSLLSEKITFSLHVSFSFLMFWLVLLKSRLGVQYFIYMLNKRKKCNYFFLSDKTEKVLPPFWIVLLGIENERRTLI